MSRHIKSHDITAILSSLTTYEVFERFSDGVAMVERRLCNTDRKTTISDLASGQFGDVVLIRESNIAEGTCRNVTEDMLRAAGKWEEDDTEEPVDLRAVRWDHDRDLRKHEERV